MPDNFIPVDQNKRLGQQLRRLVDMTREVLDQHKKIKAIMDQQTDGTVYTTIEAEFGLPTGKGDEVYNLVSGSLAAVDVAAVRSMIDWIG